MQSKIFLINLDKAIDGQQLATSGLKFLLYGKNFTHTDLKISISDASITSNIPVEVTPATIQVSLPASYAITIKVSHPTSLLIDDLELDYITNSWIGYTRDLVTTLDRTYRPLHNFYDGSGNLDTDINYNSTFTTTKLNFDYTTIIDTVLQFSYDGSVNIIFTDDKNPMRIINSRFIADETGTLATLGERNQTKDTNTYSDQNFHRTELIPSYTKMPKLIFNGLVNDGVLPAGGYRYFFRYLTADGAETNIIEESRLIEVHEGDSALSSKGTLGTLSTNKGVSFTLSNMDDSFFGIRLYYTSATGNVAYLASAYKVSQPYIIEEGVCKIVHTGLETKFQIKKTELDVNYSMIAQAKTITTANNRLLAANAELDNLYNTSLARKAALATIGETKFDIKYNADIKEDSKENYSNANFTYDKLGYWRGETYELGIVFTSASNISSVYPLRGIDNFNGLAVYDKNLVGNISNDFFYGGENSLGVYRTSESLQSLWTEVNGEIIFEGVNLNVDIYDILGFPPNLLSSRVMGDSNLSVFYNTDDHTYYINGTISKDLDANKGLGPIRGGIPHPTSKVYFNFKQPDTTMATMYIDPSGHLMTETSVDSYSKLTHQVGIYPTSEMYDGFFIVRRTRKKDKIASGVLTAAAAIPTTSLINADSLVASAGNWSGVGVKSGITGESVTFIPAPNCLMPWGIENWNNTAKIDNTRVRNWNLDFMQRAPILDYAAAKSWAFYSPDLDTSTVEFATRFSASNAGIEVIEELLPTTYVYTEHPPKFNTSLPEYIKFNGDYGMSKPAKWRWEIEGTYVESGSMNPSSKSFSAKHDRNLCLYTNTNVGNADDLDFTYYMTWHDAKNPFGAGENFLAIAKGVPGDDTPSGSDVPEAKIDSYVQENRTPSSAVNYGRYLGVRIPKYGGGISEINMDVSYDINAGANYRNNNNYQTSLISSYHGVGAYRRSTIVDDPTTSYGYLANLYTTTTGNALQGTSWESRYLGDEDTSYYAITRRYSIDEFEADYYMSNKVDVFGGDCYLGMQWKQVWSPMGVAANPGINDLDPYKFDRTALGLLDYGFAMPVPAQCNYNFHLRVKERADEMEYLAFGRDRFFLPVKNTIRGDRLMETGYFNFGYDSSRGSEVDLFRLNTNTPFIRVSYPNRVYASDLSSDLLISNGFTVFKGLNFKDYNSELGYIARIITVNNYTYMVFHHGIAQVGVNERSMVSSDTGGVFTEGFDILSSKSNVISDNYGAQHPHSVVASANYLYGVDTINKKVWRTSHKGASVISDFKVGFLLTYIIDWMQEKAIEIGGTFDVYSTYDLIKNELFFNLHVREKDDSKPMFSRVLVFNETLGIWVTETDDTRQFFFKSGEDRYSFPSLPPHEIPEELGALYKYYRGETNKRKSYYNKFYGHLYDTQLRFNIMDNPLDTKIFENLYVVGNNTIPYRANYDLEDIPQNKDQFFIPSTNVAYTHPGVSLTGLVGDDFFEISPAAPVIKWDGEYFGHGDFFSVADEDGLIHYFTCMGVEGKLIYIDKFLVSNFITQPLILGYRNPIRLTTSIYEDKHTKLVLRIKEEKSNSKLYIPRGKWIQVRLDYNGMAPMYIERILSSFTTSYS